MSTAVHSRHARQIRAEKRDALMHEAPPAPEPDYDGEARVRANEMLADPERYPGLIEAMASDPWTTQAIYRRIRDHADHGFGQLIREGLWDAAYAAALDEIT